MQQEETLMIKKLVQHGNNSALIIDKSIMDLLHIDSDTLLEISTVGTNLIISPMNNADHKERLHKSLDKINLKHGDMPKNS